MNIYDVANRLAEMREGEDVAFDIEITVKVTLSIAGNSNVTRGVNATLSFQTKNEELVYEAFLEKSRLTKEPLLPGQQGLYTVKREDLSLPLLDLIEVLGIDPENDGWYESGHGQFVG